LDVATSHFGTDVVYTTIDNLDSPLEHGSPFKGDSRVLGTVDGGLATTSTYEGKFQQQKTFNAVGKSPKMWSELWTGWFTHWGDSHAANKSSSQFRNGVGNMVDVNASFSLYMAHGGTSFGFWSGATGNQGAAYGPDVTSYDYSSPISEGADHNIGSDGGDLFTAVQGAIASKHGQPSFPEPRAIEKKAYGQVLLPQSAPLFANLQNLSSCDEAVMDGAEQLPSFEQLKHSYGLVLYSMQGQVGAAETTITAQEAHDRVQFFVDDVEVGTAYRPECPSKVTLPAGDNMKLLVENMGRLNYGGGNTIYDHKGFLGKPPVSGSWRAHCLPLQPAEVQALPFAGNDVSSTGPIFRRGHLHIQEEPTDTFLDLRGFTKGYVWVNGWNLGRYWETAGPQHTLYLPGPFLRSGENEIIVLDLHGSSATSLVSVAAPRFFSNSAASMLEFVAV